MYFTCFLYDNAFFYPPPNKNQTPDLQKNYLFTEICGPARSRIRHLRSPASGRSVYPSLYNILRKAPASPQSNRINPNPG
ncbi:hypothetical protein V2J09_000281 [Rumex salicifolius]